MHRRDFLKSTGFFGGAFLLPSIAIPMMDPKPIVETFIFEDSQFIISVKKSFLAKVPVPENLQLADLILNHNMQQFFHNDHGPALYVPRNGYYEFWKNGRKVSDDEAARMTHNMILHGMRYTKK